MIADRAADNRDSRKNKQIMFIVFIYFILTMSSRLSAKSNQSDQSLITKIQNKINIQKQSIVKQISMDKLQGIWQIQNPSKQSFLSHQNGRFQALFSQYTQNSTQMITLDICIKNGQYVDDGSISFRIPQLQANWSIQATQNKLVIKLFQNKTIQNIPYIQDKIFKTIKRGQFIINNINLQYNVKNETLQKYLIIKTSSSLESLESEQMSIKFNLKRQKYNMSGTILFALILFLIAYSQFSACLNIIRKFIQGQDIPNNYSFWTLVMAMMWDAALCLTAFVQAFKNQQNIVLFIIPAFILCLLFTNLQLRIMISVFQIQSTNTDIRRIVCKFNCISYSALILMYPLLIISNMGTSLFMLFSLIFLPQIYTNAVIGKRPDPNSVYYNQFLLYRFFLVLYLRCFPYNIFELRPNYFLGFGCLGVVACQFGLLWVQKIYGAKKVLPWFLLPSVYDYQFVTKDIQQQPIQLQGLHANVLSLSTQQDKIQECSICLEQINKMNFDQQFYLQGVPKLMKTPCGHIYHGHCLIRWMTMKMECPQCRAKLPAYQ